MDSGIARELGHASSGKRPLRTPSESIGAQKLKIANAGKTNPCVFFRASKHKRVQNQKKMRLRRKKGITAAQKRAPSRFCRSMGFVRRAPWLPKPDPKNRDLYPMRKRKQTQVLKEIPESTFLLDLPMLAITGEQGSFKDFGGRHRPQSKDKTTSLVLTIDEEPTEEWTAENIQRCDEVGSGNVGEQMAAKAKSTGDQQ